MQDPTVSRDRLESVDGLRAVAALAVFGFHLTWRSPTLRGGWGSSITGHFDTGVEVFFVLSGFLIFWPFAKALVGRLQLPATGAYAARRAIRVWPGYLAALLLALLLGLVEVDGWRGLLKHGSLTYLYFEDRGGRPFPVAWTLVVELSFYALVPCLAVVLRGARDRLPEVALLIVASGAWAQHLVAYDLDTRPWIRVLPPAMLTLGLGMLFASVRAEGGRDGRVARSVRALAARPAVPLALAAAAFAILVLAVPAGTDMASRSQDRFVKELLQAVIAGGIALPVLLHTGAPGRWRRLLAHPIPAYLGTVSFGVYLWHLPVLRQARPLLVSDHPPVAVFGWALALAVTVAVASASWYLVERPAMRLVQRRLGGRRVAIGSPAG